MTSPCPARTTAGPGQLWAVVDERDASRDAIRVGLVVGWHQPDGIRVPLVVTEGAAAAVRYNPAEARIAVYGSEHAARQAATHLRAERDQTRAARAGQRRANMEGTSR